MATVVVLGGIITDLVARAPRMPHPGESLFGDEFAIFLGGKAFNQAIAAARLGAQVTLLGCVGTDPFGDAFFPVLDSEGINSAFITRDPSNGTGISSLIIASDTGQNAIVVFPRANLALTAEDVENCLQTVISQRVLPGDPGIFLAQCETSTVSLAAGLRLAHNAGMTTILNVAPIPREPLEDILFRLVDIVIVNETEAAQLTGIAVDSLASAKSAAERLLALGPEHAIITLGEHGSLWSTRATPATFAHHEIRSFPVKQVDATAAGDAFCGALAAALAQGMEIMVALKMASAAGSVTVTRMGAYPSLPTAAEVETLIKKEEA